MLIKRNKLFANRDYTDLINHETVNTMKELRSNAAKELIRNREKLKSVKDKGLRDALRDTYLQGSKYKAEIFRKALKKKL